MKTAYFTVEGVRYYFLGFFEDINAAEKAASVDDAVVSINFLYRTIEEAKNALNNIPLN
jgi:hypothetical protein